MKILKLKLRGAIGIRKGLGVDEVEIDFTQFGPGLIAVTGRNGSGKTTIMENLHPYRCMVSRDGSIQSHFFLKDSYRMLAFELDGNIYESKILIDALTGASEAYLIHRAAYGLETFSLNDGKLTTYDSAIEHLLGTPELFFNSVFSGQKSKGIAELKPADRRKLFYELLNLDSYETYLERSKRELRDEEFKLAKIEGETSSLEMQNKDTSISVLESEIVNNQQKQNDLNAEFSELEKNIEHANETIKEFEIEVRTSEEALKQNEVIEKRIAEVAAQIQSITSTHNLKIARLNSDLEDHQKIITKNGFLLKRKDEIESALGIMETLRNEIASLKEKRSILIEERGVIQKDYFDAQGQLKTKQNMIDNLQKELSALEINLRHLEKEINNHRDQASLISEVPCGNQDSIISKYDFSGCQFLKNAHQSRTQIVECMKQEKEWVKRHTDLAKAIYDKTKELNKEKTMIEERYQLALKEVAEINDVETMIKKREAQLADCEKQNIKQLAEQMNEAEHNIQLYQQKYDSTIQLIEQANESTQKEIERLKTEAGDLQKKLDIDLPKKLAACRSGLVDWQRFLQSYKSQQELIRNQLDEVISSIIYINQDIDLYKKNEEKLALLQIEKRNIEDQIREWTFLTKAFDKTGIPVLKLENSGIEITTIANELLSLFENKFRIVFETTSLTKDKKKMKETFDINVVDDDGVCEIANKSGGQKVFIETAIRLAISYITRQQGKNIQTSFFDEADGALDWDNAQTYVEILKKAHAMSNVHNTFMITQRNELLDFIPQQIKLTDGYLQLVN